MIDDDPGGAGGDAEARARMPAHLSEDEMTRCSTRRTATTPLGRRDRAILELFYASGLRLSELAGLDVDDVNLSARMVRVLGKGGKERHRAVQREHRQGASAQYLSDRETLVRRDRLVRSVSDSGEAEPQSPDDGGDPLFVNYRGGRLTVRSVDRLVRRYVAAGSARTRHQPARAAALVRHAPAAARRRPARDSGTARPRAALSTTQRYTHVNAAQLLEVYRKSHPRAFKSS